MLEVIKPGLETSVQDYPGRIGYWNQGFPPSGPMDSWSFRWRTCWSATSPERRLWSASSSGRRSSSSAPA